MHYYQHHIGDFIRDTSRLPDSHLAAYLRMIWMYYESENPLPANNKVIGLKIGADPDVVELILEAYFRRDGDFWRHKRCDEEISDYHQICERNLMNGKKGGRPKKSQTKPKGNPVGSQSVSSGLPAASQPHPSGNPDKTLSSSHDPLPNSVTDVTGDIALTKKALWAAGKSLLMESGVDQKQCGTLVGKLVKDYGEDVVMSAIQSAVVNQPADPTTYLIGLCKASKKPAKQKSFASEDRDEGIRRWEEMTGRIHPDRDQQYRTIDIGGEDVLAIESN